MKRTMACLLLLIPVSVAAETLYVTDQLRLGVHVARDTSDKAFTYLNSGDRVEKLQRDGPYMKVRLEDGREGWVRAAFLLSDEPAARKLRTLTAERDRLAKELAAARNAGQARRIQTLERRLRDANGELSERDIELEDLRRQVAEQQRRLAGMRTSVPMSWLALAVVVSLIVGGLSGWWWFDRASRRRHGGYRVY